MKLRLSIALLLIAGAPLGAGAGDGVFEINQACSEAGCFPGDAPKVPVTITAPGSYRLTSDLVLDSETGPGGSAILIETGRVTLDLNGFSVRCASARAPCNTAFTVGIESTSGTFDGITVRNGAVEEFGGDGIRFFGEGMRIENVNAVRNGGPGIRVGHNAVVTGCIARDNNDDGIHAGPNSLILGNTVQNSGMFTPTQSKHGIECGERCVVAQNTSSFNAGDGVFTSGGGAVRDNSAFGNGGNGITALAGSVVTGNAVNHNGGCGLRGGSRTAYSNNTLTNNNGNNILNLDLNREVHLVIPTGTNICGSNTNCTEGEVNLCN